MTQAQLQRGPSTDSAQSGLSLPNDGQSTVGTGVPSALRDDAVWFQQLTQPYQDQVAKLTVQQVATMKAAGTWLAFQKQINASIGAKMAPTQVTLIEGAIDASGGALGSVSRAIGNSAADVITRFGRYLDDGEARALLNQTGVPRPQVTDPKLTRLVDQMYHGQGADAVGRGSTADAIRYEKLTGQQLNASEFHDAQKAPDLERGLENWIESNPEGAISDRIAAEEMLTDLVAALAF